MKGRYALRESSVAVEQGDGKRHCAWCGDCIDPVDWCPNCTADVPCGTNGGPHRRLRKRADAAFCDTGCKSRYSHDVAGGTVGRRRQSMWA